jgi:hypothetical protein
VFVKLFPSESVLQDVTFARKEVEPLQAIDAKNQRPLTERGSKEMTTVSVFVTFASYHRLPFTADAFTEPKSPLSLAEADADVSAEDGASLVNWLAMCTSRFAVGEQLDFRSLGVMPIGRARGREVGASVGDEEAHTDTHSSSDQVLRVFSVIDDRMLRIISDKRKNTG